MKERTLRYTLVLFIAFYVAGLVDRAAILHGMLTPLIVALIYIGAGTACFLRLHAVRLTGFAAVKSALCVVIGALLCLLANFYGAEALRAIYATQAELTVWAVKAVYDAVIALLPGLFLLVSVQVAMHRLRLPAARKTALAFALAALLAAVLSVLVQACTLRLIPSELVGAFGAEIGTHFVWIFEELLSLVTPGLLLAVCVLNDGATQEN